MWGEIDNKMEDGESERERETKEAKEKRAGNWPQATTKTIRKKICQNTLERCYVEELRPRGDGHRKEAVCMHGQSKHIRHR